MGMKSYIKINKLYYTKINFIANANGCVALDISTWGELVQSSQVKFVAFRSIRINA